MAIPVGLESDYLGGGRGGAETAIELYVPRPAQMVEVINALESEYIRGRR